MGWAYGIDENGREIGYGVVAICDFPGCTAEIDRGLAYVCGTMHGGENGCGNYFCGKHRHTHGCEFFPDEDEEDEGVEADSCHRVSPGRGPEAISSDPST